MHALAKISFNVCSKCVAQSALHGLGGSNSLPCIGLPLAEPKAAAVLPERCRLLCQQAGLLSLAWHCILSCCLLHQQG